MTIKKVEEALVALRDGKAVDGYRCVGLKFVTGRGCRTVGKSCDNDAVSAVNVTLDRENSIVSLSYSPGSFGRYCSVLPLASDISVDAISIIDFNFEKIPEPDPEEKVGVRII